MGHRGTPCPCRLVALTTGADWEHGWLACSVPKSIYFGHSKGDKMTNSPSDEIAESLDIAVLLLGCPNDTGNITSHRGLLQ